MKFNNYLSVSMALMGAASAGPVQKRDINDADILNYALTLEHLEDKFYRDGLAMFTEDDFDNAGFGGQFYENLKEISYDETTHVSFLTTALQGAGFPAVAECTYNFGITDVESFITIASLLEGVGVTAYLGAAASISSGAYLTAAGSILTVEARHNAYLRAKQKHRSPFPQAFDVPLNFNQVFTLAAPFIVSCPETNPPFIPLMAFPSLTAEQDEKIYTGDSVTVSVDVALEGPVFAAFITVTGPVFTPVEPCGDHSYSVELPAGVHGQSYLVLTKSSTEATDETVLAGPAVVEISGSDGLP